MVQGQRLLNKGLLQIDMCTKFVLKIKCYGFGQELEQGLGLVLVLEAITCDAKGRGIVIALVSSSITRERQRHDDLNVFLFELLCCTVQRTCDDD
jgi:hypothetical protein